MSPPPVLHVLIDAASGSVLVTFTDAAKAAEHMAGIPEQVSGRVRVVRYVAQSEEPAGYEPEPDARNPRFGAFKKTWKA